MKFFILAATLLSNSALQVLAAPQWIPIAPATALTGFPKAQNIAPAARDYNLPAGLPLRTLFDNPVRDPHILHAPDGYFYMVATASKTTLPAAIPARDDSDFWTFNDGIPLWRSKDLQHWETLGYVWQFERNGTWQKAFKPSPYTGAGKPVRAIWAPEIQYLKGNYWILYSLNYIGTGILKSTTGKPEGPYVDVKPSGPLATEIDATIFEDSDGTIYYLDGGYRIAKMKPDLSDLAEPIRQLDFRPAPPWGEGINMKKVGAKYVWTNAGTDSGSYDCYSATADSIYGPYLNRYRAIPYAGHNDLFQDNAGNWWSTLFHPNDYLNLNFRPSIVPLTMSADGIIAPKRNYPRPLWKYSTSAPNGDWTKFAYKDTNWQVGAAGFGDTKIQEKGPITNVATRWTNDDLWLRRKFNFKNQARGPLLFVRHSGPIQVTLNNRVIYAANEATKDYISSPFDSDTLRQGENILAVHIQKGDGLAYFDAGIVDSGERLLLPTAREKPTQWRYTTEKPADNWMQPAFKADWPSANGGFGTIGGAATEWKSDDIWLRREFALGKINFTNPMLRIFHDEDAEIYLNGVLAAKVTGFTGNYVDVPIAPAASAALKTGANTIAVHCRQTQSGQFIDVGIVDGKKAMN